VANKLLQHFAGFSIPDADFAVDVGAGQPAPVGTEYQPVGLFQPGVGKADNFLPRVGDAEKLVKEISAKTFYMNLTQQIVAEDGRVTASIGPVEQDLDGHIIQQLGHTMRFYGQLYRPTWDEVVTRLNLMADDIVEWLADCPLFDEDRLKLLKPAIAA